MDVAAARSLGLDAADTIRLPFVAFDSSIPISSVRRPYVNQESRG